MKQVFKATAMSLMVMAACLSCHNSPEPKQTTYEGMSLALVDHYVVSSIADRVVALGTLSDIDEEEAFLFQDYILSLLDDVSCSSACKVTDDGKLIVGRNMDYPDTNCPVCVFKTDYGTYKTFNLAYVSLLLPTYDEMISGTPIEENVLNLLPYLSHDVMNEAGLYIEENMRLDQDDAMGQSQFMSTGTNPGKPRVCSLNLPQYLASRCRTVGEVLQLLPDIDVFTGNIAYLLSFFIADAEGRYGVLEIANNEISFLENQSIQTNFYLTNKWRAIEKYGQGMGRYAVLEAGLKDVNNEWDMHNLLSQVCYSYLCADALSKQFYQHADFRSDVSRDLPVNDEGELDYENGDYDNCTTAWLLDTANTAVVEQAMYEWAQYCLVELDEAERREMEGYWMSVVHIVGNCTDKTMTVQFWENPNITFTYKW